jgi:hypothetical protein
MKKILAQRGEGAKEELGHSEQGIDECPTLTPATDRRNDSKVVAPHSKICAALRLHRSENLVLDDLVNLDFHQDLKLPDIDLHQVQIPKRVHRAWRSPLFNRRPCGIQKVLTRRVEGAKREDLATNRR